MSGKWLATSVDQISDPYQKARFEAGFAVLRDAPKAKPELTALPEPVMAQFDRLPLPMQMRVAADVLRKVNLRCVSNGRRDAAHENWWPTKLAEFAALFEREEYEAQEQFDSALR